MQTARASEGDALVGCVEAARRAWPRAPVTDAELLGEIRQKLGGRVPSNARAADLLIARACAMRDEESLSAFEAAFFGEIDTVRASFGRLPIELDDVRQRLRERLFLHNPPSIATYSGQGDLRGWVRAAALHLLLNVAARERREQPTDDAFFDAMLDASADAEVRLVKRMCREDLRAALAAAFSRMPPRDRTVLRYAFADGLGVDDVGAIYRVHRATAARWIAKARDRFVRATHVELTHRLGISRADAMSIIRAALSGFGSWLGELALD
jgi:RNA polymerase sigma-70 factor (ECF subfamily)